RSRRSTRRHGDGATAGEVVLGGGRVGDGAGAPGGGAIGRKIGRQPPRSRSRGARARAGRRRGARGALAIGGGLLNCANANRGRRRRRRTRARRARTAAPCRRLIYGLSCSIIKEASY